MTITFDLRHKVKNTLVPLKLILSILVRNFPLTFCWLKSKAATRNNQIRTYCVKRLSSLILTDSFTYEAMGFITWQCL